MPLLAMQVRVVAIWFQYITSFLKQFGLFLLRLRVLNANSS